MVEMEILYEGELRTVARHGPSGRELETDAPVDNQGRGESHSPTDLLASALGSCMLTIMGILARRKGWPLDGARIALEKHMAEDPRRVGRLVLLFEMPPGLPEESHGPLEQAARTCPVARSIHPDIALELRFDWAS